MNTILSRLTDQLTLQLLRAGEVPNPGSGEAPPGFERFTDLLSWSKWLALGVLLVSLFAAGARMGFGGRHGDGEEHAGRIGRVLLGVITVSAAYSLVAFLAS